MSNAGQAVLSIGGAVIGGIIGGIPGAQLGFVLGSGAGSFLFPTELPTIHGPKLDNLQVQVSSIGAPIPHSWGRFGQAGNVVWSSGLLPTTSTRKVGGKGAPSQKVEETTYTIDVAVAGPAGLQAGIRRLWADAICILDRRPQFDDESDEDFAKRLAASSQIAAILTFYTGSETQLPDPTIESYVGVGNALAYRGLSYFVLTGLDCEPYGKRLPNLVAEWYTEGAVDDEDCSLYSVGQLIPWNDGLRLDPRFDDGTYRYSHDGVTWFDNKVQAVGGLPLDVYGGTRNQFFAEVPHGFSRQHTLSGLHSNCQGVDLTEKVTAYWWFNSINQDDGAGSCDALASGGGLTLGPEIIGKWGADTVFRWTGEYSGGGTFLIGNGFWVVDSQAAGEGAYFDGQSQPGSADLGSGNTLQYLSDYPILIQRTITPPDPCAAGTQIPLAPEFCILADGTITRAITWTLTAGTYKCLQPYDTDGSHYSIAEVTQYPVDPTLPLGHDSYDDEAYWTAAYDAAVAAGKPIASGLTYGVDYPVVVSSAYVASCGGDVVDVPCTPVATIVADICRRCGLTDSQFDVSDITSCVEGYIVPQPMSGREMIAPLMAFGLFDAVESQGVIVFRERGHDAVATLTLDDLAAHGPGQQRPTVVETRRILEESLPRTLRLQYVSPERDYETGEAKSSRATVRASDDVVIRLPIAMSDEAAAQLVQILHYNQYVARTTYQAITTRARLPLEATDPILLPVDGYLERMRIVETTYATGGLYRLALQRDDVESYTSTAVPSTPPGSGTGGGAGSTVICGAEGILLDLPRLRTQDTDGGYYFAARSLCNNFTCAELYRANDGETFIWVGRAANEATIGTVITTDLDGSSPDTLEIELDSGGPLESATDAQLDVGLNLAAVGADGRWLIVQYNVATLDTGDTWVLQVPRVGLLGTGAHLGDVTAGDRFVLLRESDLVRIDETPAACGTAKDFKVAACGEQLDAVDEFSFTTECLSYLPPVTPPSVISCTESTPPTAPTDGDAYLVGPAATGAWAGHEGEVCTWKDLANSWQCVDPPVGVPIYCTDAGEHVTPDASGGTAPTTDVTWTPAIPPLPEITGGAVDPDADYLVVWTPTGYVKVLVGDLATGGGFPDLTYVTGSDESADLPNSLRLVGEYGIDVDVDATTNEIAIRLSPTFLFSMQAALQFKDEGVNVGSAGTATSLDVVGSGGALTRIGNALTLTLSGGGNTTATYVTGTDESGSLPNSLQLLGEGGVVVDVDATTNEIVVRAPLTTKGDLFTRDSNGGQRLPVGADYDAVQADSTTDTGLRFGVPSIPSNPQSGNYTIQASDRGRGIDHASGAGSGDTYTIPSNAGLPLENGFTFSVFNMAADDVTVAITSDTLRKADTGATGSVTIGQYGVATFRKCSSTVWLWWGIGTS